MTVYNYEWVLGATLKHCAVCYSMAGVVQSMEAWASSVLPGFHEGCGCSLRVTLVRVSVIVPVVNVFLGVGVAHGAPQDDHLESAMFERFAARHDKMLNDYEMGIFTRGVVGGRGAELPQGGVAGESAEESFRAVLEFVGSHEEQRSDGAHDQDRGGRSSGDQPVENIGGRVSEIANPEPERLQPSPPPDTPAPSAYDRYVELKDRQFGE